MNPTPIYTEALREAKRRTRKGSPERADLVAMDERTAPKSGRSTGPSLHFSPPVAETTALGAPAPVYVSNVAGSPFPADIRDALAARQATEERLR